MPNVQIDGTLNVDGTVFIPTGTTTSKVIPRVTSTDNAIVRFDGITGNVQNSNITIDDSGNIGSGTQSFNGFGGSGFKNYIINGSFEVNQKSSTLSSNNTNSFGVFMDMWKYANIGNTSNLDLSQDTITYNGTTYKALKAIAPTAITANVIYSVYTNIEDKIAYKLQNKVFTVSFLAEVNNAGNYSFNIRKLNDDSSVTTSFVKLIPLVVGVNKVEITVPANSANITSSNTINGRGLNICFGLWDSSVSNTAEGWVTGNFASHLNTFKWWNINGGYLKVAQFQLEEGSVATPFENRPYGLELSLCQRYLPVATGFYAGYAATNAEVYLSVGTDVKPRVPPTGILYQLGGNVYYTNNASAITNITFFAGDIDSNTLKINPTGAPLTSGQGVMVGLPKILFTGCEL